MRFGGGGGGHISDSILGESLFPFGVVAEAPGGEGGLPYITDGGCSSKFSKETRKSYHIGCGSSQFCSLKVTSEIFIHRNNTGILK